MFDLFLPPSLLCMCTVFIAAGAAGAAAAGGGGGAAAAAKKATFNIKLLGYEASKKVAVVKELRSVSSFGLKEAKDIVEQSPKVVKKGKASPAAAAAAAVAVVVVVVVPAVAGAAVFAAGFAVLLLFLLC